jgi:hypothetical protein
VETYRTRRLKFILQGGEKHAATGHSFVAESSYASALGRIPREWSPAAGVRGRFDVSEHRHRCDQCPTASTGPAVTETARVED